MREYSILCKKCIKKWTQKKKKEVPQIILDISHSFTALLFVSLIFRTELILIGHHIMTQTRLNKEGLQTWIHCWKGGEGGGTGFTGRFFGMGDGFRRGEGGGGLGLRLRLLLVLRPAMGNFPSSFSTLTLSLFIFLHPTLASTNSNWWWYHFLIALISLNSGHCIWGGSKENQLFS